jgi:hypothetical protein
LIFIIFISFISIVYFYFCFHFLKESNVADSLQAAKTSLEQEKKRESLGRKVSTRPSKDQLAQQNILKDTKLAPALQSATESLQQEQKKDSLERKLESRPTKDDLVDHNIMKGKVFLFHFIRTSLFMFVE